MSAVPQIVFPFETEPFSEVWGPDAKRLTACARDLEAKNHNHPAFDVFRNLTQLLTASSGEGAHASSLSAESLLACREAYAGNFRAWFGHYDERQVQAAADRAVLGVLQSIWKQAPALVAEVPEVAARAEQVHDEVYNAALAVEKVAVEQALKRNVVRQKERAKQRKKEDNDGGFYYEYRPFEIPNDTQVTSVRHFEAETDNATVVLGAEGKVQALAAFARLKSLQEQRRERGTRFLEAVLDLAEPRDSGNGSSQTLYRRDPSLALDVSMFVAHAAAENKYVNGTAPKFYDTEQKALLNVVNLTPAVAGADLVKAVSADALVAQRAFPVRFMLGEERQGAQFGAYYMNGGRAEGNWFEHIGALAEQEPETAALMAAWSAQMFTVTNPFGQRVAEKAQELQNRPEARAPVPPERTTGLRDLAAVFHLPLPQPVPV